MIHELAHFRVNKNSNFKKAPHGSEWKNTYKLLMLPFLNNTIFPDNVLSKLAKHMKNPSATTDSDIDLVISLSKYDKHNDSVFLFDVLNESLFEFNNQTYKKIGKLRKRYICKDIIKNKKYLFSPVTRVKKILNEKNCCQWIL